MDNLANGPSWVESLKFANCQGICAFPDEVTLWTMWSIRSETEPVTDIWLRLVTKHFPCKVEKTLRLKVEKHLFKKLKWNYGLNYGMFV